MVSHSFLDFYLWFPIGTSTTVFITIVLFYTIITLGLPGNSSHFDFWNYSLGTWEYHATSFWPANFLLKNNLMTLWVFLWMWLFFLLPKYGCIFYGLCVCLHDNMTTLISISGLVSHDMQCFLHHFKYLIISSFIE